MRFQAKASIGFYIILTPSGLFNRAMLMKYAANLKKSSLRYKSSLSFKDMSLKAEVLLLPGFGKHIDDTLACRTDDQLVTPH